MALVERHRGLYGLTHADQFLEGPASGTWVIFIDTEEGLGSAVIHVNESDESEVYTSGSVGYNYWQQNVNDTGDFILGPDLTNGQMRRMNLVIWMEGFLVPAVQDAHAEMQSQGWTPAQRIMGVASILVSNSIPLAEAQSIATNFVNSSIKPTYLDLGITDIPVRVKRLSALLAKRSDTV